MIFARRDKRGKYVHRDYVKFEKNYAGQGGTKTLTLKDDNDTAFILTFESVEEVRQLLSLAHILWSNINDERMP